MKKVEKKKNKKVGHLIEMETTSTCIKVAYLRTKYGSQMNLKTWMEDEQNVYVGRNGRIFIDGKIFHYSTSIWANPFTLKKYSLEESIKLYEQHLIDTGLINRIGELKGKCIGCFCETASNGQSELDCHTKVLLKLIS